MLYRRLCLLVQISALTLTSCKTTSQPAAKTASFMSVELFAGIADGLMRVVQEKAKNVAIEQMQGPVNDQVNQIFAALCTFSCTVIAGADDEETKEVAAQQTELELKTDTDLKWGLALEIQSVINQARKIVPGSSLAPTEIIDLRRRLSEVDAKIALTLNNIKDPVKARRALVNFNTFLLFAAVGNWVDDIAVDIEIAAGADLAKVGQYRQAQFDFLSSQITRLNAFETAADTVLVTDKLKEGNYTVGDAVQLGVEKNVRYVYWGEYKGQRLAGSPSTTVCSSNYNADCAKKALDEAKANYLAEVLPVHTKAFRAVALGVHFDEFKARMTAMSAQVAIDIGKLKAKGVVIPATRDIGDVDPDAAKGDQDLDQPKNTRDGADEAVRDGRGAAPATAKPEASHGR